jgi:hypothetical protein
MPPVAVHKTPGASPSASSTSRRRSSWWPPSRLVLAGPDRARHPLARCAPSATHGNRLRHRLPSSAREPSPVLLMIVAWSSLPFHVRTRLRGCHTTGSPLAPSVASALTVGDGRIGHHLDRGAPPHPDRRYGRARTPWLADRGASSGPSSQRAPIEAALALSAAHQAAHLFASRHQAGGLVIE